jgi:hypothetical protein
MSLPKSTIFEEAQKLSPIERAELIELLIKSFDIKQSNGIDEQWAKETESR